jgi:acyl-CoA dehydrogenase
MRSMPCGADQSAQILGGRGFMRSTTSGRIDYEVKVMIIGGSSEAILKNLAASQLGI